MPNNLAHFSLITLI